MAIMFLGFPEYILAFSSIGHKSTNTWGSVDLKFSRSGNFICLRNGAYTGFKTSESVSLCTFAEV